MLRDALVIFRKELRDTLRDRRTLIFVVLLPLVMVPLLGTALTRFMESAAADAASKTLDYALVEDGELPELRAALDSAADFRRVEIDSDASYEDLVGREVLDMVLVVSADDGRHRVEFFFDNAPVMSKVKSRVEHMLESVSAARTRAELEALGLDERARTRVLEPVLLIPRGLASERVLMGERTGGMLPYVFILFCFLGALYPAIDLGAGEKERGTLETVLLAPMSRTALVLGKFGVIFTTGLTSTLLGTLSMGIWLYTQGYAQGGALGAVLSAIGPMELVMIALLMVPIAVVFAAVLLAISIYAKSFKEAQSYMAPLNMLLILPAAVATLPGIELDWRWSMVPIANVSLAMKEVVKGTLEPQYAAVILVSSFALAVALLFLCAAWFRRESVLFRQ